MSTRQDNLLAALQRKRPAASAAPGNESSEGAATAPAPPPSVAAQPKRRVGKPVQFWLHEEDRRLVRELAAWLAGQGIRPTDSMVVRASLRMARTGSAFLEAYRQAAALDGRLKLRPPGSPSPQ